MSYESSSFINMEETSCLGFSAYRYYNKDVEIVLVPGIGGRIMGYGYRGSNFLYLNESLYGKKVEVEANSPFEMKKERMKIGFLGYGGEKTWLAPEGDWGRAPYLDLDNGAYEMDSVPDEAGVKVHMRSRICRETHLRLTRTVHIPNHGTKVSITQQLENLSLNTVKKGLWQVTMINRPGVVVLPLGLESEYEGGMKDLRKSAFMNVPMEKAGDKCIVRCESDVLFKVGTDINKGYVDTLIPSGQEGDGKWITFRKEFKATSGPYGHGCAVEVYNSKDASYFEVEVHSPLIEIEPGEFAEYTVDWSLGMVKK